ncbi:MAG: hypothetical protein G01um101416_1198 [Microgenomates group bacterium Gr01-1014_16]|nr:MAG: hypothetical protein G01um101416_1198 [Microgenomates group bacterium Gr01-1014_16]
MKKIPYKTDQNHPAIRAYSEAVEKGQGSYHVVYRGNEWIVMRADSQKPRRAFTTQGDASVYAQDLARKMGTALFVHGMDGKIVDRRDNLS